MKPMKSRIILMFAVLTGLCSCQVAELSSGRHGVGDVAFSIDDAREFFEADYSAFRTKAQCNALPSRFSPGDYTPMWEDAEYSVSGSCAAYDVAVLPERSLVAIRSEFGMNGARAERLRVYQKLVVMKNTASGVMGSYILSLIPDVGSDDRRIPQRFLSRGADKGGFSGIAVYTSSSSGSLHSVQQFKDGVKVRGVNLDSGEGSRLVRCRKAMSILSGIVILSKKSVTTKAGEDMWDDWYDDGWDYGDAGDYTYIGDGIYEDENGDLYMDINGDGVIDAFLLEGSECTPDDDEDDWPEEDDDDWPEDEQDDIPDGDGGTSPEDPDEFWDGSEYGGGVGGTNGTGVNIGGSSPLHKEHIITPEDRLAREGMPTEMTENQVQTKDYCMFSSLSYIASVFGDDINVGEYVLSYIRFTGENIVAFNGVDFSILPDYLNEHYSYEIINADYDNICAQIDLGNVLLGIYMISGEDAHAIVLIGYNEENNILIYVDPEDGKSHSMDYNDIDKLIGVYSITKKNS